MDGTQQRELRLSDFDISEETGFVPPSPPLARLSHERFSQWEELVRRLPTLIAQGTLRDEIHRLPVVEFSPRTLVSEAEWRRAYVLLTFLSQAYIWAEGEAGLPDRVPRLLAVPWVSTADHLGLPPVATYASTVLYNWRFLDHCRSLEDVEKLAAVHTYTGTEHESWFYMIPIAVEMAAVPGIKAIVEALSNMASEDEQRLIENLRFVAVSLKQMQTALKRMYERCDQEVFQVKIRPFQAGTKGLDAFPNGLVYEGVSPVAKKLSGASAAQSSAVPSFDIFLGAVHTGADAEFLAETRQHMPPKHRLFLEELGRQPSVREYVKRSRNQELIQAYNGAVQAFSDLRTEHVIMVTSYIVNQRGKSANKSLETRGSGGTDFMKFLKKVRDDTKALLIEV